MNASQCPRNKKYYVFETRADNYLLENIHSISSTQTRKYCICPQMYL